VTSIHGDHLGSTRLTTDQAGRVSGRYEYDPFGRELRRRGPKRDQRLFYGEPFDGETGLTYMNARYYDAELARFISADSILPDPYRPQSLDRYAYVEGDPLNYTDPSGHLKMSDAMRLQQADEFLGWAEGRKLGDSGCESFEGCIDFAPEVLAKEIYGTETTKLDPLAEAILDAPLSLAPDESAGLAPCEACSLLAPDEEEESDWTLENAKHYLKGTIHGFAGFAHSLVGNIGVLLGVVDEYNFEYKKEQWAERGLQYSESSRELGETIAMELATRGFARGAPKPPPGMVAREMQVHGTFSIFDWGGYPKFEGVHRPEGPFRLLTDEEYSWARKAANRANRELRRNNPSFRGLGEIHEIHPVKFGGSPTDPANKVLLPKELHSRYTTWWRMLQRGIRRR
jgi:RHS repeat-associated protein